LHAERDSGIKSSVSLPVTKLSAAQSQIDTAIELWFRDADPVSVHTLTAAARRILLDLSRHQGLPLGIFAADFVRPGCEREYKKILRRAETFFKHAENDPDEKLDFNPESTQFYLLDAIESFYGLTQKPTFLMNAFRFRLVLFHPAVFIADPLPTFNESFRIKLRSLEKGKFLEVFPNTLKFLGAKFSEGHY
jgi:hypothetical protein